MPPKVKICGISSAEAMAAALAGGARAVGLNFYPPSPRYVTRDRAADLAAMVPEGVERVGVFVDVDDATFEAVLAGAALTMLQLHGREDAARLRAVKARFGLPVIKAVKVAAPADLEAATPFLEAADMLLFDAKAPRGMADALPGGNALSFDWQLIAGRRWALPWMLSGGLTAENLGEAVATTGAAWVDVSSGVEDRPGHKDPALIAAFLAAAERS